MKTEQLIFECNNDDSKIYLKLNTEIKNSIEIDFKNGKIDNLKNFFEELIVESFIKDVIFDLEIPENVVTILNAENENLVNFITECINMYRETIQNDNI